MSLANAFLLLLTLTCVRGTPILADEHVNMIERHVQGLENNDIWPLLNWNTQWRKFQRDLKVFLIKILHC